MPKRKIEKTLYQLLYPLVNFFIAVGELAKDIIMLPFRLLLFFVRKASAALILFGKTIDQGLTAFRKWIKNIRKKPLPKLKIHFPKLPKIVIPRIKKPKFRLRKPRFLKFPKLPKLPAILKGRKALRIKYFFIGFIVAALISFASQAYQFVTSLPSPRSIGKVNYPLSTHIYDRKGRLLYEVYREQNRTPVRVESLPPYVTQATIAIEDKDFFRHNGVSLFGGIFRATKETLVTKKLQGGSTITQQLVKSALLTPERTIQRKLKEIVLALWTERIYTKNQILEMYLNQVPYGGSAYGIEEAAKAYFNKHAKDLTLDQAAFLAGLPQAPTLYSSYLNPQLALARRNDVLKNMIEQKFISQERYEEEVRKPLGVVPPKTTIKAPHFVFYVKSELEKQFGIRSVEEGGLRVTTSLDLDIQEKAQEILSEEIDKIRNLNVTNGAILIIRPSTGEILAMVGSTDYFATPSGAFNVTTALRQPGSAIKPIMYSLALKGGFTPATILNDSPVVYALPGEIYRPVNYDGRFHGRMPLRYALANSYNVPAVKTLSQIGVSDFVEHARQMGISTWKDSSQYGLSLTLGGGDVKMLDMAKAFGVFANNGERIETAPAIRVDNFSGDTIFEHKPKAKKALDPGISYIISDILSDNVARQQAFGVRSALEIPGYKVAVKTGTTNDKRDNWTIGYTPEFLVVVWVGNNNNSPMHPQLTSGITGAAPIWNKVMSYLLTTYSNKNTWFNKPEDVVSKSCYGGRVEYFLVGTEGTYCQLPKPVTPTPEKEDED